MPSKTPNFDKTLDEILKDLKPHTRACKKCAQNFEIFKEDIEFYHKLRVPPPTLCPDCRKQRRLAFSNNTTFYKRKCDAPGHSEEFISLFPAGIPWKVYDHSYWWSDVWDSMDHGRDYNPSENFISQFEKLYKSVPLIQANRDPKSTGSDYTAYGMELKDCYYAFGGIRAENCLYGNWPMYSRDCLDVLIAYKDELCYEVVSAINDYNCNFIYFSDNCLDSAFLYDCKGCTSCFGCTNLRNKRYYFFNQPCTKEDYENKIKNINLSSRKELESWQNKFVEMLKPEIKRSVRNEKTTNSIGTFLRECKDCFMSFWVENGENIRYIAYALGIKDSMDINVVGGPVGNELCYECCFASTYNIKFSHLIRAGQLLEYCINCFNCENCFGCVGLRNKKYCIFNKQYSEEDYWKLVDKIKTNMLAAGEYGEFFPISMSPYPYNASLAQFEYPLSKAEVEKLGGYWAKSPISLEGIDPKNILKSDEIPDDIKDVGDDILQKVLICEVTGKPFIITKPELEFYRRKNLPLPMKHPYQRILERWEMKEPFRLWKYPCSQCGKEMYTSYAPEKKLKVYCEKCYIQEVV